MKIKNLTNNVKEYLSGLDIIGEIAIIKIKEIYIPHKNQIGNLVIDNFHNIKSVFLQESSVEGGRRDHRRRVSRPRCNGRVWRLERALQVLRQLGADSPSHASNGRTRRARRRQRKA